MTEEGKALLIGEYSHTLDAKGRINFPARLRDDLGEQFIITKGLDTCLSAYPMAEWRRLEEKLRELPRAKSRVVQRFIFAGAVEVTPDKQGRIVIPSNLRDYAGIERDVVIIGASDRVEIWDAGRWAKECGELTAELVAETMDELGF